MLMVVHRKYFQAIIISLKLKASLRFNALQHIHSLTFINEVLRFSGSPFVAITVSP